MRSITSAAVQLAGHWQREHTLYIQTPVEKDFGSQKMKKHQIEFRWVRGHVVNVENEKCDQLSAAALRQPNLSADEGYEKKPETEGGRPENFFRAESQPFQESLVCVRVAGLEEFVPPFPLRLLSRPISSNMATHSFTFTWFFIGRFAL